MISPLFWAMLLVLTALSALQTTGQEPDHLHRGRGLPCPAGPRGSVSKAQGRLWLGSGRRGSHLSCSIGSLPKVLPDRGVWPFPTTEAEKRSSPLCEQAALSSMALPDLSPCPPRLRVYGKIAGTCLDLRCPFHLYAQYRAGSLLGKMSQWHGSLYMSRGSCLW